MIANVNDAGVLFFPVTCSQTQALEPDPLPRT